ncbi:hypothetical protein [uncultured Jatrophihabitans sp.]|uniref:hypothetical protein n=1 Tax=uncultured Jatrophihabitans sp. TaxID=1610747 RepID=UPI0035C98385
MTRARSLIAALAVAALVGVAVVAHAYWSGAGHGTGAATTGSALAVTLTSGTPTDTLYPGGQAAVETVATSPNDTAVIIASLTLDTAQGAGGFAVDSGHAGCAVSSLSFTTQINAGAGWRVPARVGGTDGTLAITLPNALTMSVDAVDACQGAQFTVYLSAG